MARQWFIPDCGQIDEIEVEEWFIPDCAQINENQAAPAVGNPYYAYAQQ